MRPVADPTPTQIATPHGQLDPARDAIPPDDTTAPQQILFYLRRLCILTVDTLNETKRVRQILERAEEGQR